MLVESWLQIEGFTFGVRKPLTFSGQGYLSSLALSFLSPIFSAKRILKIGARHLRRGGEVFSLTVKSCTSSFKRSSPGIARYCHLCPQRRGARINPHPMSADLAGPSLEAVSPSSSESSCPSKSTELAFSFKFVSWFRTGAKAALNISAKVFAEGIF